MSNPERQCATCGSVLTPKPYELKRMHHFKKRATCGLACDKERRRRLMLQKRPLYGRYRRIIDNGRQWQFSRFLMEKHLGRKLLPTEHVHHVNHDSLDDRIENYEVIDGAQHISRHKSKHPRTQPCVICGQIFTPRPTKRMRAQACGRECETKLRSQRKRQHDVTRITETLAADLVTSVSSRLTGTPPPSTDRPRFVPDGRYRKMLTWVRKARKEYVCSSCMETIRCGAVYRYTKLISSAQDATFEFHRHCRNCAERLDALRHEDQSARIDWRRACLLVEVGP